MIAGYFTASTGAKPRTRKIFSYKLTLLRSHLQKTFKMVPHSEQADRLSNQLNSSLQISGKDNGDMTLTVLGCGEYVLLTQQNSN